MCLIPDHTRHSCVCFNHSLGDFREVCRTYRSWSSPSPNWQCAGADTQTKGSELNLELRISTEIHTRCTFVIQYNDNLKCYLDDLVE